MNTSRGFTTVFIVIALVLGMLVVVGGAYVYKTVPRGAQTTDRAIVTPATPANTAVQKIMWLVEPAYPEITSDDDYRKYFDKIAIRVTFNDGTEQTYPLGMSLGCSRLDESESEQDGKKILGRVQCYFALSGTDYTAYVQNGRFVVEQYEDDASGMTAGKTTIILKLPEQRPAGSGFRATPREGGAPLTVAFYVSQSAGSVSVGFGDGASTNDTCRSEEGCDVGGRVITHTYSTPGTYSVTVGRLAPSAIVATTTIRVN